MSLLKKAVILALFLSFSLLLNCYTVLVQPEPRRVVVHDVEYEPEEEAVEEEYADEYLLDNQNYNYIDSYHYDQWSYPSYYWNFYDPFYRYGNRHRWGLYYYDPYMFDYYGGWYGGYMSPYSYYWRYNQFNRYGGGYYGNYYGSYYGSGGYYGAYGYAGNYPSGKKRGFSRRSYTKLNTDDNGRNVQRTNTTRNSNKNSSGYVSKRGDSTSRYNKTEKSTTNRSGKSSNRTVTRRSTGKNKSAVSKTSSGKSAVKRSTPKRNVTRKTKPARSKATKPPVTKRTTTRKTVKKKGGKSLVSYNRSNPVVRSKKYFPKDFASLVKLSSMRTRAGLKTAIYKSPRATRSSYATRTSPARTGNNSGRSRSYTGGSSRGSSSSVSRGSSSGRTSSPKSAPRTVTRTVSRGKKK